MAEPSSPTAVYSLHGRFDVAALTDPGNVRTTNEDSFLVDPSLGLVLVADGMSGHGGGAMASALAVKSCHDYLSGNADVVAPASDETVLSDDTLSLSLPSSSHSPLASQGSPIARVRGAVEHANSQIHAVNQAHGLPDRKGIGTTMAGLYWPSLADSRCVVFHVGDCRVYRLRDGVLHHLTRDHSAIQRWLDGGLVGPAPARNMVLRAVGPSPSVLSDVTTYVLLAGDVILLCSDGITAMVSDRDIGAALAQVAAGERIPDAVLRLADRAKSNGGKDNLTVALGVMRG
ncbi:MAG: PP2C family protein-serine/threonine phosphatase [Alphaproteobacteria bacterium]